MHYFLLETHTGWFLHFIMPLDVVVWHINFTLTAPKSQLLIFVAYIVTHNFYYRDGIISTEEFYHLLLYLDSEFEKSKALVLYSEVMAASDAERKESQNESQHAGRFIETFGEANELSGIQWAPDSMLVASFTNVLMKDKLDPTRAKDAIEREQNILGDDTDDDFSDAGSVQRSSARIDNRRGSVSDVASRYIPPSADEGHEGIPYSHKLRSVWKEVESNLRRDMRHFPKDLQDEIEHRIQHLIELMDQSDAMKHDFESSTDRLMLNAGWIALDMLEK